MPDATLRSVAKIGTTVTKSFERAGVPYDSVYPVPAATAIGTVIRFVTLPTYTRVHGDSFVSNTALGAGTISFGFTPAKGETFAATPAALATGLALTSVGSRVNLITDISRNGMQVWELMGLDKDPGGWVTLIGTTAGANTTAAGTIALFLSAHHG